MTGHSQEVVLEALPGEAALVRAASRPLLTHGAVLWIARVGRLAAIWLPVFIVCSARLGGRDALAASLVFSGIWKLTLRHAYAGARVTVWAIGAPVAAAVGAIEGMVAVAPLTAWVPAFRIDGWTLLELTAAVIVASTAWEQAVMASLAARRRVLVVGAGRGGAELVEEVALSDVPFEIVGVVDDERGSDQVAGAPLSGTVDELAPIVERERPQIVVLADDACRARAFDRLLDLGHLGFSVVGLAEFYEYAFGRLPVRSLTPQWFMSILHLYQRPYSRLAKRAFDVAVAGVALVLTAPLFPLLALLVRRTPGPVVFRQTRLGEGGRHFTIYKFRTMRADAETSGAVWAAEHDPRVTSVGRFMRRSRLDELPQLWNVLMGDMSIVGPRPERPEFLEQLQEEVPYWKRRHLVKPGLTGWAQVRRGYTADAAGTGDKLSYDLWYLRHRSLVVDFAICVKTFATLVTGSGAR